MSNSYWRRCSVCKTEIGFESGYQQCSVSSCKKSVYCTRDCFDVHVPFMRHKDAWSENARSPSMESEAKSSSDGRIERQGFFREPSKGSKGSCVELQASGKIPTEILEADDIPVDILVVTSKLKGYIKAKSGFSTSQNVLPRLSEIIRKICDEAILKTAKDGRKTVMDRDF